MEKKQSKQFVYFYNSNMTMTSPTSSYQVQQQTNSNAPTTPHGKPKKTQTPNRRSVKKTQQPSTRASPPICYAGSGFSDSPSARHIPLPPTQWIEEVTGSSNSSGSDSDTPSSSTSRRISSSAPVPVLSSVPELHHPTAGLRVNPLQLIAAVASS
ncbi:hypothetical protein WR25_12661 [Diploscapter pachys]|uniref:Uncharacterized protein n=1 Tax=Diploscapter pachys TaxID=2018661 RepID=A0A2A2KQ62_9BILA|nr:hypothetical protein WR25_12661 [Diploscapter pachys]